jgi:hypothetical protein
VRARADFRLQTHRQVQAGFRPKLHPSSWRVSFGGGPLADCTTGNLWRRLALPRRIANWSLTSLQQRLVKTGGRLIKHARYYWLLLAESHLTRPLFGAMVQRMAALTIRAG